MTQLKFRKHGPAGPATCTQSPRLPFQIHRLPGRFFRLLVALWIAFTFTSCAHHYRLATPSDLSTLPFRRGWEGFNVVAVTPWRYMGSKYESHEFRYYYNRDNALNFRDVSVARDRTILRFEEKPYRRTKSWATLQTDGQMFYFSLLHLH